jgi:translation initiation factor 1
MSNKNKHREGVVYSTNPQFVFHSDKEANELPSASHQQLRVRIEKQHRGGKSVTVVDGFSGRADDLLLLGKTLKIKCGVGGTVKDGLILIQGEQKERVIKLLIEMGHRAK